MMTSNTLHHIILHIDFKTDGRTRRRNERHTAPLRTQRSPDIKDGSTFVCAIHREVDFQFGDSHHLMEL